MLISYSHKFLFIHVWKTAGSSIEIALSPYAYNFTFRQRLIRAIFRRIGLKDITKWKVYLEIPHRHVTAKKMMEILGQEYDDFFSFAFVRNPFDWLVSQYHDIIGNPPHRHYELAKHLGSMDKYIEWRINSNHIDLQKSFISDQNGCQIVNFIGKYENLEDDIQHISRVLNIPIILPHVNKSQKRQHKEYKNYYHNVDTVKMVQKYYHEDFQYFNYDLEL